MKGLLNSLLLVVVAHIVSVMSFRKFETVGMVPNNYFEDQKTIYCFVERCIDGDTIRCRHIPGYSWRLWSRKKLCQPLQTRGIADQTLSIRVYGVDCPEIAKNTRQTTQPFGDAAHEFTKSMVLHKVVRITFLRRDQYGRAVAAVETIPPFPFFLPTGRKDLSAQLAKHGLAELYMGGGAEYWNKRDILEQCIETAKRRKLGIWSMSERISAAEHKKLQKENRPLQETTNRMTNGRGESGDGGKTVISKSHPTKKKESSSRANHLPIRKKSNLLEVAITGLELVA